MAALARQYVLPLPPEDAEEATDAGESTRCLRESGKRFERRAR